MQREPDEGLPVGIRPAPGKLRRPQAAARIAARVARFGVPEQRPRLGLVGMKEIVQPLNPGFFQLEALRQATVAKKRGKTRAKVRGK